MESMYLYYFTNDESFPFYIQYGHHEEDVFMHVHADYSELVIVLDGTAMHYVNDESYMVKKGDVFVINDGTCHGYKATNDFRICNIMYSSEILNDADADFRSMEGYHALFVIEPYLAGNHGFKSRLRLNLENFEVIKSYLDEMLQEYSDKRPGWKTAVKSRFFEVMVKLSRHYVMPDIGKRVNAINIAKAVSYIEQNFQNNITVEMLAAMSHLSVRHFSRVFQETYGISPGSYVLSLRMQHAVNLLRMNHLNISEIALNCGFSDSNYFTRCFKKYYGTAPREYRRKGIKNEI